MKLKILLFIITSIFLLTLVSAEIQTLGVFKQNSCIDLKQQGADFTSCNVTSVTYPNSTSAISNLQMDKTGNQYNLTFCNTNPLGEYIVNGFCTDTSGDDVWAYNLYITYNGREEPSEFVIVFFCLAFLIVIGFLSYLIIYNIGHLGQMDYDLGDLIKNVSAYFVLLGLYMLSIFYLGNEMIDSILGWIIGITGFTNVAMSFLFFIIVLLAKRKAEVENAW